MTGKLTFPKTEFSLSYNFTEREIRNLAKFLRNNQESLPDALIPFATKVERAVYDSMSIDEAEAFYS
ncbi:MAG: hypothetical protein IJ207_02530 [Treponema sp.]|uniref:hypothetical protein n=1 Tax=Treponema sp. TaxID=166 RepID=UPI0025CF0B18|nr:hypothetical protein [Treponema sp.]MBQ9281056.1 hypothetical protein [Treponema sp.]